MQQTDFFVIGGGSGGVRFARRIAAAGYKCILADPEELGGTCVNNGCIPKKLYSYAGEFANQMKLSSFYGWQIPSQLQFDWSKMHQNTRREITRLNRVYEQLTETAGITVLRGKAKFVAPNCIECLGEQYQFNSAVIASGAQSRMVKIPGIEHTIDSDGFFALTAQPESAIVLGGGFIAFELASILQQLGSKVKLLHRSSSVLRGFDQQATKCLLAQLRHRGLEIQLNSEVTAIKANPNETFTVTTSNGDETYQLVITAYGRVANTLGLDLAKANIESQANGYIKVDENFCTSNPHVFAIGDVINSLQLTPLAIAQGERLFTLLSSDTTPEPLPLFAVPSAVFTNPCYAMVGATEQQAVAEYGREQLQIFTSEFAALRETLHPNPEKTFIKLICRKQDQAVVGVHLVGSEAAEIVQMLTPFVQFSLPKRYLDHGIGIHPSVAEELFSLREHS